jgi:hypothetical protein
MPTVQECTMAVAKWAVAKAEHVRPDPEDLPTLIGVDDVLDFIHNELGIPLARWRVAEAIRFGDLPAVPRLKGNHAGVRPRDVREWLARGAK